MFTKWNIIHLLKQKHHDVYSQMDGTGNMVCMHLKVDISHNVQDNHAPEQKSKEAKLGGRTQVGMVELSVIEGGD